MKKLIPFLVIILIGGPTVAQEFSRPHVSVSGYAKQEVTPDLLLWNVNVQNIGAELESVSREHTEIVKDVLDMIRKQGIDKKDIQTSGMRFGENYTFRNNSRVKEGYMASTAINFEMQGFESYESLWLALSKQNAVSVNSVSYDYSKREELQDKVRIEALLAAREKAKTLTEAMGLELGEAIVISESSQPDNRVQAESMMMRANNESSAISAGTITIEMNIHLVMALIPE